MFHSLVSILISRSHEHLVLVSFLVWYVSESLQRMATMVLGRISFLDVGEWHKRIVMNYNYYDHVLKASWGEGIQAHRGCLLKYCHWEWGNSYWRSKRNVKITYLFFWPLWPMIFHWEGAGDVGSWEKEMKWVRETRKCLL